MKAERVSVVIRRVEIFRSNAVAGIDGVGEADPGAAAVLAILDEGDSLLSESLLKRIGNGEVALARLGLCPPKRLAVHSGERRSLILRKPEQGAGGADLLRCDHGRDAFGERCLC